jgi:hypothetical protein
MKQGQKTTVTLAMIWIGFMMIASRPGWIRNALGFVTGSTGAAAPTTVASAGGSAGSQGMK